MPSGVLSVSQWRSMLYAYGLCWVSGSVCLTVWVVCRLVCALSVACWVFTGACWVLTVCLPWDRCAQKVSSLSSFDVVVIITGRNPAGGGHCAVVRPRWCPAWESRETRDIDVPRLRSPRPHFPFTHWPALCQCRANAHRSPATPLKAPCLFYPICPALPGLVGAEVCSREARARVYPACYRVIARGMGGGGV